jgi:ABC-type transport system involved in cytochrome c biogenesis ATPase subunit
MSQNTELQKLINYVSDYVDITSVSDKICEALKAGEKCRNALAELSPSSTYAQQIVEEYDEAFYG